MNNDFLSQAKLENLTQTQLLTINGGKRTSNIKSTLRHFEMQYLNGIL